MDAIPPLRVFSLSLIQAPIGRAIWRLLLGVGLLMAVPSGAWAAEGALFCVRCSSPDVNYLCAREDALAADTAMKFYCIERASKQAGHAFCSIQKNAQNCVDPKMTFIYTLPSSAPARVAAPSTAGNARAFGKAGPEMVGPSLPQQQGAVEPAEQAVQSGQSKPPQTLLEATSHLARNAKQGMDKIGKNFGKAVKKTGAGIKNVTEKTGSLIKETGKKSWNCLSSFFTKC